MKGFLRDNGLSLVLIGLFVVFFVGQAVFGWLNYNDEQEEHHQPQIGFMQYLTTGAFGEAVFENWESEFLQMGLYVVLTAFLFQRGSSESKDPDKKEEVNENADSKAEGSDVPLPVKKGGLILMLYNHSLSLALILLFAISFVGHAVCGARPTMRRLLSMAEMRFLSGNIYSLPNFGSNPSRIGKANFWPFLPSSCCRSGCGKRAPRNQSPLRLPIGKPEASLRGRA
jgi:hypothetical protein